MEKSNPPFPRLGKLRVLTNHACNLSCLYCHKEGVFNHGKPISHEERKALIGIASEFGIDEIKFSGGEPLLYDGLEDLVAYSKELGIPSTSVTTNGILLDKKARGLKSSGLDELSVSFDTLEEGIFQKLNGGKREDYQKILEGIEMARELGFPRMNLNMALTKYNVGEVENMMKYAQKIGVPLRLISFIELGDLQEKDLSVKSKEVFEALKQRAVSIDSDPNYPAYTKLVMPSEQQVELVDSACFNCDACGQSYALRLTADGKLKPCFISEQGKVDVATPLKEGNNEEVRRRFMQAIAIKKLGLIELFNLGMETYSKEFLPE